MIGKERSNWYDDHPSACTCYVCQEQQAADRKFLVAVDGRKVGRNELCPCGSGKKFKKCHFFRT